MSLPRFCRYATLRRHTQERRPGYLDTFDVTQQVFYRDHLVQLGKCTVKLWREVLHREEIPQNVLIDIGAFGATDWRSSCPDEIFEKCQARRREAA